MNYGKALCKKLKEIRLWVARENDIPYQPAECHHKGDCAGTCPRCEAEVAYLEQQLQARRSLGKTAAVIGVGMAAMLNSCSWGRVSGMLERTPDSDSTATATEAGIEAMSNSADSATVVMPVEK